MNNTLKDLGFIDEFIRKVKQQKTSKPEISMVGFHEDVSRIKNWLTESIHDQLDVMMIVGAAGTGKTTLARNLFDLADLDYKFGNYVWISVPRTSNVQTVIRGILDSMRPEEDELDNKRIEQLTDIVYKSLKGTRYLIVLDDVWDIQVWDDIKRSFPDDNTRSRIILTTRLFDMDLGVRSSQVHYMPLLGPEISQTLFRTKVFGEEKCPQDLDYAARQILGKSPQKNMTVATVKTVAKTVAIF